MTPADDQKRTKIAQARQAKRAALVIAGTMCLWVLLQLIGAQYDWPPKYALLIDLAALAGFVWGLVATFQIWWQGRRA